MDGKYFFYSKRRLVFSNWFFHQWPIKRFAISHEFDNHFIILFYNFLFGCWHPVCLTNVTFSIVRWHMLRANQMYCYNWKFVSEFVTNWNSCFRLYDRFSFNANETIIIGSKIGPSRLLVLVLKNLLGGVGGLSHGQLREIEIRTNF